MIFGAINSFPDAVIAPNLDSTNNIFSKLQNHDITHKDRTDPVRVGFYPIVHEARLAMIFDKGNDLVLKMGKHPAN